MLSLSILTKAQINYVEYVSQKLHCTAPIKQERRQMACLNKLTHTSNAKCFRNVTLINIRGIDVIIVPIRDYGRLSLDQVMIKRE